MKMELFTPVLAWLEAGARHQKGAGKGFNMNYFSNETGRDYKDDSCGTAMCIAGAVAQFNDIPTGSIYGSACAEEIGRHIGMTREQINQLFFARAGEQECGDMTDCHLRDITPKQAARTLRHFIATKEVVWQFPTSSKD